MMILKHHKELDRVKRWKTPINRRDYLKLDLNENYSVLNRKLKKVLTKIDSFTISCYPEYDGLVDLLSKYTESKPDNITLTNGADQAIDLLLRLFFDRKSRVIMPSPVFSMYDHIFSILGSKVEHISYDTDKDVFKFPTKKVLNKIKEADGIILCNPNNPLGSIIEEEDLKIIVKKAFELKIPCIVDEAYFEFYGKTAVDLIDSYPNLIIIRTFSKVFGLAGLRLGYIVANKDITEQLLKLRGPWDINHFAVKSGEIFLNNKKYFFKKLHEIKETRVELINFCRLIGLKVYQCETNFITVKFKDHLEAINIFKENKILVNDLTGYPFDDNLLKDCIRITVPNKKGLKKLKKVLLKFRK